MNSKKSPEHRITIKIGLILLVVLLFFTGLFIYSTILKNNIDVQKEEMNNSYRILSYSNQLIVSIQDAQNILNKYLVSPRRVYQQQYDSISQNISEQIEIIKNSSSEDIHSDLFKDVDSLLSEKNLIVNRLLGQLRSQSPLLELDKRMENFEPIVNDSVVVTTSSDTTIVLREREKRDFWSRLTHLFDPKFEPDTIINITHTASEAKAESRVDTLVYADLKGITEEASRTYSSQIDRIERQIRELVLAEQNISLSISKLISQFYNETIQTSRRLTENSEMLTQKIFSFAITVGAISIFLILIIIFLISDDLNKGKKARVDLSKEKKITEELIESRHKLLLSVSHDIKTPLSSMMGYMEIWDSEESKELRKKQLKSAQNSGRHILSMLTNLLEFSRLEQKSASLQKSTFDLIELVEDILSMFRPFTDNKDIDLNFNNQLVSPYYIETDYTTLKQILINVISNSVKYTLIGKVNIELKKRENGSVLFTISDTGIGIEKDDLKKIFKPFSRMENPLKTEGSGFGLYVTKGLTESLQGNINISSEKGKGTTAVISLPVKHITDFIPEALENKGFSDINLNIYNKILIFEDDVSLGNMIKDFLIQKGFKVKLCANNRDIVGFMRLISTFDIVFTDMQMVNVNGSEILKEIRKRDTNIPVWLMTANDEYSKEKAISEGFSGFVTKPIQMSLLLKILSSEAKEEAKCKTKSETKDEVKMEELKIKFPGLASMFGNDIQYIKDVLSVFVESSARETENLEQLIKKGDFVEVKKICHKIHPFLSQLDADHLSVNLKKVDNLKSLDESSYPNWQNELSESVKMIKEFAEGVKRDYL